MSDPTPDQAMAEIEAAMRRMEALAGPSTPDKSAKPAKPSKPAKTRKERHGSSVRTPEPSSRKPATTRRKPETIGSARQARPARPKGPLHQRLITFLVGAIAAIVLPFYVLLRFSVFLDQKYHPWPWLSIAGGIAATVLLLMIYVAWARWRIGSGFKFTKGVTRGLIVLVAMYVGYTAVYISAGNVKTEQIRETYTSLHPILRLGVSTLVLADPDVVMTDGERKPEDYARMGLPTNQRSLHYRQEETGYAHAVDLRTRDREEWKNFLMTIYFKIAGFQTLRHTGTADHLHVSLPTKAGGR